MTTSPDPKSPDVRAELTEPLGGHSQSASKEETSNPVSATIATTDDSFLGGALQILQPQRGYRAGIDAVLLAAAINADEANSGQLLDLGAGVGTIGLCAAQRIQSLTVTLLEKQPELCRLARENAARNGLTDRVTCVETAIGAASDDLNRAGLHDNAFTHVVANPPFMDAHQGTLSEKPLKATSHTMSEAQHLNDWGRFMARMARQGGTAMMIHKAEALYEVLACLEGRFGSLTVLPIHPRADEPANRIIVRGIKGSRRSIAIRPGLVLHGIGNKFTPQIDAILRCGEPLSFPPH